jgi:predicted DNA-binding transcriptional regulator YafY
MPEIETTLLRLALHLQGSRQGLTIKELGKAIGAIKGTPPVTRKTVDRYRADLERAFRGQVTEEGNPLRVKMAAGVTNCLVSVTREDLAELQSISTEAAQAGLTARAKLTTNLAERLQALLPSAARRALDIDLPDLLATEGYALRPGPRPKIQQQTLEKIRDAIYGFRVISISYQARRDGAIRAQTVKPLGLIFGHRHYLVASGTSANKPFPHNYALSAIHAVEFTGDIFQRDEDFDIRSYTERSFGVWQEEPFEVVLRFAAHRAADVEEFFFHPTQKIERLKDGPVVVRFVAGGLKEIAWHLFTWSPDCEIVEPEQLREKYRSMLKAALEGP